MIIIGHRGARGLAPENTIAGLKKALALGVDQIEFDVRLTRDNAVILHHNATIVDSAGDKFPVGNCTFKDLKQHKPDLATLGEALKIINGAVPIYVEVKPRERLMPIVKILKTYKHPYSLGSFSQRTLRQLQTALPKVPKVVIENWSGTHARFRAKQLGTKTIVMDYKWLWSGFISAMAHGGYKLYAYNLNNPDKARRWAKHGLAGVVTDYPDRFKN